jgi:hypothetical protein
VRTCIVLGAGSTLANAQHFRPTRETSTHPPLDYTFFDKIVERNIPVPYTLKKYADTLPTGNPFDGLGTGARMEEFLRDLFHDFLHERSSADSLPVVAYRQLVDIYARVLRETTGWMDGSGYTGGPLGRVIAEAANASDHVDIVTFNHDLAIENEIYKRRRLRRRWCINAAYGGFSVGKTTLETNGLPHFPSHEDGCEHSDRPIVIHKMHGSLNWFIRIRGKVPTPSMLAGQVSEPDVMITVDRTVREIREVVMRPAGKGRGRWHVWPVIVPPIYAKQPLIDAFMPSVWASAREALAQSDRVIFFGYSLPTGDVDAEKLIQRAIVGNNTLPWVGVIDPSPLVMRRYVDLLPDTPLRRFPSAESFLTRDGFSF